MKNRADIKVFIFLFICLLKTVIGNTQNVYSKIHTDDRLQEIGNGLVSVLIPRKSFTDGKTPPHFPAPIQAFRYNDGQWSDNTINYLNTATPPVSMAVKTVKNSSTEIVISIRYEFKKPEFKFYAETYKGGEAGPGFYTSTFTIQKNSKSILIEEDSDYDFWYSINVTNGLQPTQARYRGWSSGSTAYGYEKPGQIYRAEHDRGYPMDATVDLNFSTSFSYPSLTLWEPAGGENNTGRYWQLYNANAGTNANLLGFFQGRPSRIIGGVATGVSINTNAQKQTELKIFSERRGPDNSWYPRKRFSWGVFISTKKDLLAPEKTQPISFEMNKWSGLGNKIKVYALQKTKLVPAFYQGAIYLPAEKIQELISKVKTDEKFYNYLHQTDAYFKPVLDSWRYPDSARSYLKTLLQLYSTLITDYTEGEGAYKRENRYWVGAMNFKKIALDVSCLFADKKIIISPAQKDTLEKLIALMARIVWDDDNAPFQIGSGINYGPANMYYMYRNNARNFFALLLANDSEFAARAKQVASETAKDLSAVIYEGGASIGTPHYTQAALDPVLFTMLQIKQAGITDQFKNNQRLYRFVDFYKSLLTPPSVRFKNYRKLVSFGDGSEESAGTFALLAAGFATIDKNLSDELYYIFENGAPRLHLFGYVAMVWDFTSSRKTNFVSGSSYFPGYLSHFRSGINTKNETALWLLNGDSLFDHRNDDAGEVAIVALNAPLSVSRSSFYYPHATDARIRSVVVPEKLFPQWDKGEQPIAERSLTNRTWPKSQPIEFAKFENTHITSTKMIRENNEWYRKVVMISVNPEKPLIVLYDSITNKEPFIWSMPFMSEGEVKTPTGNINPEKRIHNFQTLKQLPAASGNKPLKAGLNNFQFNGQHWALHGSKGINWNVVTLSKQPQQFSLSQWTTTWQNTSEQMDYLESNSKPYEEGQQFLRIKTNEPLFACILPYPKDQPGSYAFRTYSDGGILLNDGKENIQLNKNGFVYTSDKKTMIASFGNNTITNADYEITGGCAEIEIIKKEITVRVHGLAGQRKILFPAGKYTLSKKDNAVGIQKNPSGKVAITINYQKGNAVVLSNDKGYSEWKFIMN